MGQKGLNMKRAGVLEELLPTSISSGSPKTGTCIITA
jgi:hypothetical protein